ncbi:hemerythrin domain-containing protein [Nocardioides aquiterrae]|uniref:Hemerythrin domain-containing protein n=1 Tax=Nocardioides aquiterrae TaxID=203799 RepID=A0ABN1UNB9_9ACTN
MDITYVILHQHGEQRRMFAMLDEWPREDTEGLAAVWKRLEILLETHAEAEERFFYPRLLEVGTGHADADSPQDEVEDSVGDHNEIRDAIRSVGRAEPGSSEWWDAVTECRIHNDDHMAEEERRDLADFRLHASRDLRHEIAIEFLRFEAQRAAEGVPPQDKDPEEYISQNS